MRNHLQLQRIDKSTAAEISAKWAAMSPEEKTARTADKVKELEERRQSRAVGIRNVGLAQFHDTRATLTSIYEEVRVICIP